MTHRDGGPAFPIPGGPRDGYGNPANPAQKGMTLRQWYAGKAMAALIVAESHWDGDPHEMAKDCVLLADALIAELDK